MSGQRDRARWAALALACIAMAGLSQAGEAATLRAVDDLTADGTGGTDNDPDVHVKGYSAFATTPANASSVTSGAGSVYLEGSLEVDGSAYLATGIWSSSGNVGIGTTVPSGTLDVEGGNFFLPGAASAPADGSFANSQWSLWLDEAANEFELKAKKADGTVLAQTVATVGAGTGSASLQAVYDTGNTLATTSARDLSITLADSATDANFLLTSLAAGNATISLQGTGDFLVQDEAADASPFIITDEGNVGIGTDAPAALLDIWKKTDAASNQVGIIRMNDRATAADNDEGYLSFFADDDLGASVEVARMRIVVNDVTSTSKDGRIGFGVMFNNILTESLLLYNNGGQLSGSWLFTNFYSNGYGSNSFAALGGAAQGLYSQAIYNTGAGGNLSPNGSATGILTSQIFTEAASGNHPLIASAAYKAPVINAGAATVSDTATVYVESAPSATVSGGNYALWIDDGISRFDGNVGISTAAPGATLHVTGSGSAAAWGASGIHLRSVPGTYTDSSTAGSGTAASAVGASFAPPTIAATNASVTTTDTATVYIAGAPAAGANMTLIYPYALWVDAGNVRLDGRLGLNQPNPQTLLHINDEGSLGGVVLDNNADAESANLRFISSGSHWNLDNYSGTLRFFTETGYGSGGTIRATIDSNGNLGIGPNAPSGSLDVETGNFYLPAAASAPADNTFANSQLSIWLDEANDEFEFKAKQADGTIVTRTLGAAGADESLQTAYDTGKTITTADGGHIAITLADTTTDANFTVTSAASSTSNVLFELDGTGDFIVEDANGTDASPFMIDDTGNVGIGDSGPDYLLELLDATATPALALSDDDIAHGLTGLAQTDVFAHLTSLSTTDGGAQLTTISDTDAQALSVQGVIGSTNPTDTVPAIKFIGAKSDGATGMADLAAAETVFQVANNDDAAALTLLGNGNVGIGTTTPGYKLDAPGTIRGWTGMFNSSAWATVSVMGGAGSALTVQRNNDTEEAYIELGLTGALPWNRWKFSQKDTTHNMYLAYGSPSSDFVTFQTNGNVGIGTTAPAARLHVMGKAILEGDQLVDADGSAGLGVGTPNAIAENATLVVVEAADNLCTDSLTAPTAVRVDTTCAGSGGTAILLDNTTGTTQVTSAWAFQDTVVANSAYDDGEDLYIDSAPATAYTSGALTYAGGARPKRTVVLTAAGAIAGPSAGFADQLRTNGTNVSYYTLNFDSGTDEKGFWQFVVPDAYTGATAEVTLYWLYTGGNCTGGTCEVVWNVEMDGKAASDAFDSALQAVATATVSGDATAGDVTVTSPLTVTTGWAPGEVAVVKVTRDADNGADDLPVDAKLAQVKIEWTASAESD